MFPDNTMRKTGVGLVAVGVPLVTMGLNALGIGECTPEMAEAGCISAAAIAGSIVSAIGGALFWIGHNRAVKRGQGNQ